jgi:ubiquinone/menaquinone biosynthesis C-methylase UbiE
MLRTAEAEAQRRNQQVALRVGDIEALPLPARAVDLAIAGHVLYHVGDIDRGVRELARVMKSGVSHETVRTALCADGAVRADRGLPEANPAATPAR